MKVLVFNCGSSSIKYRLFEMPEDRLLARGQVQRIGEDGSEARQEAGDDRIKITERIENHQQGLEIIEKMLTDPADGAVESMGEIGACGHRVVHGGETFTGSVRIDSEVEKAIEKHADLAPLHNPPNLAGIREAGKILPHVPQVACFDTAFHQTIPETAYMYALPAEMYERYRIRRYGFHGTSHRYVARKAAEIMGRDKYDVNLVTCHLGNGCSIAAVRNGKSVDTSMGLTPLEGVVMGTRSGDLDPAIVFHMIKKGYSANDLDRILNKESGLLGLSGTSNDVRNLEETAADGDEKAKLALDIFAYRVKKYIGAYLAVLNTCDGVVFTGGIGENGARMRKRILENMEGIGIEVDDGKNECVVGETGEIQTQDSKIRVFVIPTNEEGAIALDTYRIAIGEEL